jgi:hypothetical protein
VSKITVAPPIPSLWTIDKNVWKIQRDGRIVNRLTGERHPNQIRDLEAKEPKIWTASGKRWTVNEAGKICDADTGEVWVDPDEDRRIGHGKEKRGTKWLAKYLGISRQRASKLLNDGRIMGAVRDAAGAWDLSRLATASVTAGKRGPRLSAFGQKKKGKSRVVK